MKVSVYNGFIDNSILISGYFTPLGDSVGKKLPHPLDGIYTKLITTAEGKTEEAYREEIE